MKRWRSKAWRDERVANTLKAFATISQKEGKNRGVVGYIECPACKGRLRYSIASLNGHVWGCCETEGCLSWMQ